MSASPPRILAIVHEADAGPGVFAEVARARGHVLEEWRIDQGAPPPRPPESYAAVLVLGGAMHAHEHEAHPWLADEEALLSASVAARQPVLGVCLGAQVLARAIGGDSQRMAEPEIGWYDVRSTAETASDPLFAPLSGGFRALQWHSCSFTLPPRALCLAESAGCPQAFRVGECAWGIQFHAEVTLRDYEAWLDHHASHPEDGDGPADPSALREQTREAIGGWNTLGSDLFARFLRCAEDGGRGAAPRP
jgi:GMP synthase (glutamine-hydrolysing)